MTGVWEYGYNFLITLALIGVGTAAAYLIGMPVGIILTVTDRNGICPNRGVNAVLGFVVNVFRSIPFMIFLVMVLPLAKLIVGTKVGNVAFAVPLILSAAPFVARMIESSLKEVDAGVVEAAQAMGSTNRQIVWKVLLPEAKPSLITGAAITIATILGYTPMAALVAGEGLGAMAVQYGLYRFQPVIMYVSSVLLIVIVQVLQEVGLRLAKSTDKRIRN